jgi:hypothetical protein
MNNIKKQNGQESNVVPDFFEIGKEIAMKDARQQPRQHGNGQQEFTTDYAN